MKNKKYTRVIKDLKILVNPTDEEMENLPEISGYEAEIILKEIKRLNNIIKRLEKYVIDVQISEYGDTMKEAKKYLEKMLERSK